MIQRERTLKAIDFVRICVFPDPRNCFPSLETLVDKLSESGLRITKQSLHKRFDDKAVNFLRQVAAKLLQSRMVEGLSFEWSSQFGRIMILDSTLGKTHSSCRAKYPGFKSKSGAFKLHYCFDLLKGNIQRLDLLSGHSADQAYRIKKVRKKDLWMFDLGYVNVMNIDRIREKAFFLCRYRFDKAVFIRQDGKFIRLHLNKMIKKMKIGQVYDQAVYWGNETKTPVRLILEKLPQEISAVNRRRIKKKRRQTNVSQERLAFCDVNAYITNLDSDQLDPKAAKWVYRMRWQVELVFKTWKSSINIRKAPKMNIDRLECCLWGSLIRIILLTRIMWYVKIKALTEYHIVISEYKAIRILCRKLTIIEQSLLASRKRWMEMINYMTLKLSRNAKKDKRKGRRELNEILNQPSLN